MLSNVLSASQHGYNLSHDITVCQAIRQTFSVCLKSHLNGLTWKRFQTGLEVLKNPLFATVF
jgi:hypothetical protein